MKKIVFACLAVMLSFGMNWSSAQQFDIPLEDFSRKKTSYLHMEDGSVKEGLLGGFKRSKGLIQMVKMKSESGGKVQVDPSKIKFMYLPPSAIGKLGAGAKKLTNVNNWDRKTGNDMDTSLMNDGYVYFEKVYTRVKSKKSDLMLQLVNPSFSSTMKVYHDPFAKETTGIGVAGVTAAGGLEKSYYVFKKGNDSAFRVMKKYYGDQFKELFGDSEEFMKKWGEKGKWSDFETHVFEYTEMMGK